MQRSMKSTLAKVVVGDIVHGSIVDGPSLLVLVTDVTAHSIVGRRVTTGQTVRFDRETGVLQDTRVGCIDSVEPLPADIHTVLLHLDRVSRTAEPHSSPDRARLSDAQIAALRFTHAFYPANPLPMQPASEVGE